MLMPHLIYGCVKCRVRSFHRQNELPPGNKKKKVMVIVCPLVMTVESTPPPNRGRINKWRSFFVCVQWVCFTWW